MKKLLLTPVLILFCVAVSAQVASKEKQALLDFYVATNGAEWTQKWDLNTPVSDWQGVTVTDNHVTGISLLFNNIKGEIPASIGDLSHLQTLELSFNAISGQLPETIGNLEVLEVLAFNGNNLSGTLPATLGNLTRLKQLHLSSNKFEGTVPSTVNALTRLEVFNVFDNHLFGDLPMQLANNSNLKELMIAENNFTNTDMFSIVLMSNSGVVDLQKNTIVPPSNSVIAIETSDDDN
ncbi:MAG TPA: Two component regulator three Y domain protein [Flavobacteriaceae bacterium]|jgi:Leucine-rich repeat (LRR) protein|nr:Two component regulator three Y domain protein [Flavobacteriaceae bacterium]HIN99775.1 Two component regulator three Y domain protein [Flavobacteriaceae bacterium]|tara:strand:+ start:18935 stop:19642 length:708 start_codon:yes stop_codon:yes gene_type:complete